VHAHKDRAGAAPASGAQRPVAAGQPEAGQPPPAEPLAGQAPAADPGAGQPEAGQRPPAADPEGGRPKASDPGAGQPPAAEPEVGQPPAAEAGAEPLGGEPEAGRPGRIRAVRMSKRKPISAGRNLPAAAAVGCFLGALVLVTLFTVKVTFLAYVGIIVIIALWELSRALGTRGIRLPLVPVTVGGAAMYTLAYWYGAQPALAALALSVVALMAWRLPGGATGYLRDLTAGIFALAYLPLLAVFLALILARTSGARQALIFIVLAICSDIGGYAAGVLIGRHPLAKAISPKKTWEGLAGSVAACLAAGAILLPWLLSAHVWQGLVLGAAAAAAATLGDLAESMIKRDLQIKDMGHVLPGHGGILDRIDSMLIVAPVVWLLLTVFVPGP
jgi:phosphatidate cytidylyltransferase